MPLPRGFLQLPPPSRGFRQDVTPIGARIVDTKTDIEWIRVKSGDGIHGGAWNPVSSDLLEAHNAAMTKLPPDFGQKHEPNGAGEDAGSKDNGTEEQVMPAAAAAQATGGRRRARAAAEKGKVVTHPTARGKRKIVAGPPPKAAAKRRAPAKAAAKRAAPATRGDTYTHCTKCGYEFKNPRMSGVCNSTAACAARRSDKSTGAKRGRQAS